MTWSVSVFVINYSSEILDWVFKDQEAGPGLVINLFSLKNPDALNDRLGITP